MDERMEKLLRSIEPKRLMKVTDVLEDALEDHLKKVDGTPECPMAIEVMVGTIMHFIIVLKGLEAMSGNTGLFPVEGMAGLMKMLKDEFPQHFSVMEMSVERRKSDSK